MIHDEANDEPCRVCAVRTAVYLVLMADKAGDSPEIGVNELCRHAVRAMRGLAEFRLADIGPDASPRAAKAADSLAKLVGLLLDLAAVHDDEQCTGGHE
jgi:hypothetical protein